jgi:hypothetical protein
MRSGNLLRFLSGRPDHGSWLQVLCHTALLCTESIMSLLAVQDAIATLTKNGRDVQVEAVAVTLYNGIVLKGMFKHSPEQRTACVTGSSTALADVSTHVSTFFDLEDVVSFTYAETNQRIEY